ncbi:hypothetical protein SynMINOS11_00337 [Synechococcus sp. Minos11]|nr:hypothetical protein SynMINOS11_00337 [Synechococcus sp. Minos11]
MRPNPEALDIRFRIPLRIAWPPASLQQALPQQFRRLGFEMKPRG